MDSSTDSSAPMLIYLCATKPRDARFYHFIESLLGVDVRTTIDLGASRYFVRSKGTPSSEKSSELGKAVSTILFSTPVLFPPAR